MRHMDMYKLGGVWARYDARDDCFYGGNWWVRRCNTQYADTPQ